MEFFRHFRTACTNGSVVPRKSDDDFSMPSDDEKQVTYEVCLDGNVALSISRSSLSTAYLEDIFTLAATVEQPSAQRPNTLLEAARASVNMVRDILQGAECRLCRRSSTGFRSGESGGHTNRYEAEFVIFVPNSGSSDQLRLAINACKYYTEGECGWDEGLDVHCYANGQELVNLRRDGSDSEYDAQSVNRGLLQQLSAQMLVPASEAISALMILWQILCAPLIACSRWDEDMPRLGLGLPHRKDDRMIFQILGVMFAKLAVSVSGNSDSNVRSIGSTQIQTEDTNTSHFLRFVLEE